MRVSTISGGLTLFAAATFMAWTGGATWPDLDLPDRARRDHFHCHDGRARNGPAKHGAAERCTEHQRINRFARWKSLPPFWSGHRGQQSFGTLKFPVPL